MKVFLADDSDVFRERVVRHLAEHPAIEIVGEASDGEQALAAISSLQPDVVLLDLHMPKVDGYTVLHAVKRRFSSIKVIVLTNNASPVLRDTCVALGAVAVVDKKDTAAALVPLLANVGGEPNRERADD